MIFLDFRSRSAKLSVDHRSDDVARPMTIE